MREKLWISLVFVLAGVALLASCTKKKPHKQDNPDVVFDGGSGSESGTEKPKPHVIKPPKWKGLPKPKITFAEKKDRLVRKYLRVHHRLQVKDLINTLDSLKNVYVIGFKKAKKNRPWLYYGFDSYRDKINQVPVFTSRTVYQHYMSQFKHPQRWERIDFDIPTALETMAAMGQYFIMDGNRRAYVKKIWLNPNLGKKYWERIIPIKHMQNKLLFHLGDSLKEEFNKGEITGKIKKIFAKRKMKLPPSAELKVHKRGRQWEIVSTTGKFPPYLLIRRERGVSLDGKVPFVLRVYINNAKFLAVVLQKNGFKKLYFAYKKRPSSQGPEPLMGFAPRARKHNILTLPIFTRKELALYHLSHLKKHTQFRVVSLNIGAVLDEMWKFRNFYRTNKKGKIPLRGVWLNPGFPSLQARFPLFVFLKIREMFKGRK